MNQHDRWPGSGLNSVNDWHLIGHVIQLVTNAKFARSNLSASLITLGALRILAMGSVQLEYLLRERVTTGPIAALLGTSAVEGEADKTAAKADIDGRTPTSAG
jgi:hypothetical protein